MLETVAPARSCCALERLPRPAMPCRSPPICSPTAEGGAPILRPPTRRPSRRCPIWRPAARQWEETARRDPDGLERGHCEAPSSATARCIRPSERFSIGCGRAKSTFAVMATGRGKSLRLPGATPPCRALTDRAGQPVRLPACARSSPTRRSICGRASSASVSRAPCITGESTPEERARCTRGWPTGAVDIVLTTPEYLACSTPTSWRPAGASGSSSWTRRTTSARPRPASAWPTPSSTVAHRPRLGDARWCWR